MTTKELTVALDFYGITGESYRASLAEALDRLNGDPETLAAFQKAREEFFTDSTAGVSTFWHLLGKEHFFGAPVEPLVYDLFLLSGHARHAAQMKRYHFDAAQTERNREGLRFELEHIRGATMHRVLWGILRINGKITEFGRLQFEFQNLDGRMPTNRVKIHIPAKGKLEDAAVGAALSEAERFLPDAYGVSAVELTCTSWLLSPQIIRLVSEDSNLRRFYDRFTVTEGESCLAEVLAYVWQIYEPVPYDTLPETSSLQRAVKKELLAGGDFRIGCGALKTPPSAN